MGHDWGKITDPRKLLQRRYQMMILHLGLIIALIVVSTFEVRSAILLAIHCTSAVLFLIYVPASAILTWRASRRSLTPGVGVSSTTSIGKPEARRRGLAWDCAGVEVGYLAVQCATTLASSILCALTLSSQECFGTTSWALDEFAEIKERDVDDWCQGVIGATVLSFVQFILDLVWLGWIVSVVRAGTGVRSGEEGQELELTRRASRASRAVGSSPTTTTAPTTATGEAGAETHSQPQSQSHAEPEPQAQPHTHHLFQTMFTPTPQLLTALAERRYASAMAERRRMYSDPRERMRRGQFAPTLEERRTESSSTSSDRTLAPVDLEAGENVPGVMEVPPPYHGGLKAPDYPGLGTRG